MDVKYLHKYLYTALHYKNINYFFAQKKYAIIFFFISPIRSLALFSDIQMLQLLIVLLQ